MHTHPKHLSQPDSLCELLGLTNNSMPYYIKEIGMFQKQHSRNVKTKLQLHKAPAGNQWHYNSERWGATLPFLCFFHQTQSVQSLLLRRFGIKSRTKTQHVLTANHHSDADIFLKKQKGDGAEWQRCSSGRPAKLCASTPSPGCRIKAAMSIITSQTAKETQRGELGGPNKDRFQVSACWSEFCGCTANK